MLTKALVVPNVPKTRGPARSLACRLSPRFAIGSVLSRSGCERTTISAGPDKSRQTGRVLRPGTTARYRGAAKPQDLVRPAYDPSRVV